MALHQGDMSALTLLNRSAVFSTVDHRILLRRLRESYDIGGIAMTLDNYVTHRPSTARI